MTRMAIPVSDWDLLTGPEQGLLRVIGRPDQGTMTPHELARQTGWTWQRCARIANELCKISLVRACRLPKQVSYELTPAGEEALKGARGS